jgi:hypothetical protein
MKEYINKHMNEIGPRVDMKDRATSKTLESLPGLVLRTAARFLVINTYIKNTEKNNSLTGSNTVIYGNIL